MCASSYGAILSHAVPSSSLCFSVCSASFDSFGPPEPARWSEPRAALSACVTVSWMISLPRARARQRREMRRNWAWGTCNTRLRMAGKHLDMISGRKSQHLGEKCFSHANHSVDKVGKVPFARPLPMHADTRGVGMNTPRMERPYLGFQTVRVADHTPSTKRLPRSPAAYVWKTKARCLQRSPPEIRTDLVENGHVFPGRLCLRGTT